MFEVVSTRIHRTLLYCKTLLFYNQEMCESTCTICRLPRCLPEDFEQLHRLPDPVPGDDLHYKSFEELYGKQTTEDHRPSLGPRTSHI